MRSHGEWPWWSRHQKESGLRRPCSQKWDGVEHCPVPRIENTLSKRQSTCAKSVLYYLKRNPPYDRESYSVIAGTRWTGPEATDSVREVAGKAVIVSTVATAARLQSCFSYDSTSYVEPLLDRPGGGAATTDVVVDLEPSGGPQKRE